MYQKEDLNNTSLSQQSGSPFKVQKVVKFQDQDQQLEESYQNQQQSENQSQISQPYDQYNDQNQQDNYNQSYNEQSNVEQSNQYPLDNNTNNYQNKFEQYSQSDHYSDHSTAIDLVPCPYCGRKFSADRIEKHKSICSKPKTPKKIYNSAEQRSTAFQGEEKQLFKKSDMNTTQVKDMYKPTVHATKQAWKDVPVDPEFLKKIEEQEKIEKEKGRKVLEEQLKNKDNQADDTNFDRIDEIRREIRTRPDVVQLLKEEKIQDDDIEKMVMEEFQKEQSRDQSKGGLRRTQQNINQGQNTQQVNQQQQQTITQNNIQQQPQQQIAQQNKQDNNNLQQQSQQIQQQQQVQNNQLIEQQSQQSKHHHRKHRSSSDSKKLQIQMLQQQLQMNQMQQAQQFSSIPYQQSGINQQMPYQAPYQPQYMYQSQQQYPMKTWNFCPYCGSKYVAGAQFCFICGEKKLQ